MDPTEVARVFGSDSVGTPGGREGPSVEVVYHCTGCRYDSMERDYDGEKEETIGWDHFCTHPLALNESMARYTDRTPAWCPFLKEET